MLLNQDITELERKRQQGRADRQSDPLVQPTKNQGPPSIPWRAYFDASGTTQQSHLTVAGFVSRVRKWDRFEAELKDLLAEYNPTVSTFHMTDYVSKRRGWESWGGDREAFQDRLISSVRRNTNKGFACTISKADYDTANAIYQLQERHGSQYVMCCLGCLFELGKWAKKKGVELRYILCIFERGEKGQNALIKLAASEGFEVIFQSKQTIRAFDSCDFAAWKSRRIVEDIDHGREVQSIVRSLDAIARMIPVNLRYSKNGLLQICQGLNIPKR